MGLAGAISGLLLAWIVIRMALQFMPNPFMRNIFTLTIWSLVALSLLGILDNTAEALDALALTVGTFRLSALTVAKGSLAVFFLLYLATIAATLLEKRIHTVAGLSISSRVLLGKIIRVTLIVFALLIAITAAGIDLSLLAVFSGAVGLGVGFGLQKVASNLFSGMMLLMDRSITPGDVIELPNGAFGWVNHMGARYTEIVTRDNKAYLVPNEDFVTQQVINWSHGDRLIRIEVQFGVHYDSDPHLVKKLAEEVAQKPERVVGDPSPVCHLVEFGDSSLNFVLRFWIEDAEKGVTNMRGAVMLALWDAFKENDISIPYPHREVFMHNPPEKNRA
jgi:small-conductance mechanosensitive channel